jgi:predicted dehydrogenase
MAVRVCRWGILSTATIGRKNWLAIRNSGNGTVAAVASRSKSSAQQFIHDCQAHWSIKPEPRAYGSYQELIADPDIDAVYVPLPTGLRKEWVVRAAEAGKHVVCEKPCAPSTEDLREMIEACDRNKVQFMDGVMYMHSRRLAELRKAIDDEAALGTLKRIATQFSFCAPPEFFSDNIRSDHRLEPQGCLGDLGWYTTRFALWVMDYDLPVRVIGRMLDANTRSSKEHPVPTEFSGELFFEGGVTASFYNSFQTHHQQFAQISGTKSQLRVADFVLPYFSNAASFERVSCEFNPTGFDFNMEPSRQYYEVQEQSNGGRNSPETNLFRTFGNLVLGGRPDPYWPNISLKTQVVLDALLKSARNGGEPVEVDRSTPSYV